MDEGTVFKRMTLLGLAIEKGTSNVPDDDRFYVTVHGAVRESCKTLTIAEAVFGMVEEEILAADPALAKRRNLISTERALRDVLSARAESAAVGKSKATAKGGKGGRSGV